MKEITWEKMIQLNKLQCKILPFILDFYLKKPIDKDGNIGFSTLKVLGFKGLKAIVECDSKRWLAVSADEIYVEII